MLIIRQVKNTNKILEQKEKKANLRCLINLPHARRRRQLPRNFSWKGRYLVPDLGIEVPFSWVGNNGDVQMTAGLPGLPVYFTNLIFQQQLYTYTYAWPGLQPEFLPPLEACTLLFPLTVEQVNAFLATASYVGPEILEDRVVSENHHRRPRGGKDGKGEKKGRKCREGKDGEGGWKKGKERNAIVVISGKGRKRSKEKKRKGYESITGG